LADREKRLKNSAFAILTRWSANVTWKNGNTFSPKGAVAEADDLVSALMNTRGYSVSDFDQRAADISVDHPRVVEKLSVGTRNCLARGQRRSKHGRSQNGNGALSLFV